MADLRTSRQLSERVEIEAYRRPNRFRRATWWLAMCLAVLAVVWVVVEANSRDQRIYEGGRLATPHRMFENDCAKCHITWGPVKRLITLSDDVPSTDNQKCITCHTGPKHHDNQVRAHNEISCAECHRDHAGLTALAWVADRLCTDCHEDLKTTEGPSETFATRILRFDGTGAEDHPEFAMHTLYKTTSEQTDISRKHGVFSVMDYFQRDGESTPRWQDKARIRFNHAVHLKAEYGPDGKLIDGLVGKDGRYTDLSKSCTVCHKPDPERRYILPINYQKHCAHCHPLYFDVERFPGESVPHESPAIVRGFLTDRYTLHALTASNGGNSEPQQPTRKLPGRWYRDFLSKDQTVQVKSRVALAEQTAQQHVHSLLGREAKGGCRYCHEIDEPPDLPIWKIVPPEIPERWAKHSKFRHDSHRMLRCTECHQDFTNRKTVVQSKSTGDVLLPVKAVCIQCHSSQSQSDDDSSAKRISGARTNCVECHNYHNYQYDNFLGELNSDLQPAIENHSD